MWFEDSLLHEMLIGLWFHLSICIFMLFVFSSLHVFTRFGVSFLHEFLLDNSFPIFSIYFKLSSMTKWNLKLAIKNLFIEKTSLCVIVISATFIMVFVVCTWRGFSYCGWGHFLASWHCHSHDFVNIVSDQAFFFERLPTESGIPSCVIGSQSYRGLNFGALAILVVLL